MLIILFLLALLVVLPLTAYSYERSPARRAKFITALLASAQLHVDDETWASLDRYTSRRVRWGAVGNEIGTILSIPLVLAVFSVHLALPTCVIFVMMAAMGRSVGNALSGLTTTSLTAHEPRFASLRPHGATDYLNQREILVELGCGAAGVVTVLVSAIALAVRAPDPAAWLAALAVGATVTAATLLAGVLQKRLLEAPVHASSSSHLIARDVVLAQGLRDLFNAVVTIAAVGAYGWLFLGAHSLALALLFLAGYVITMRWFFGEELPPSRWPVARQLAWENRS